MSVCSVFSPKRGMHARPCCHGRASVLRVGYSEYRPSEKIGVREPGVAQVHFPHPFDYLVLPHVLFGRNFLFVLTRTDFLGDLGGGIVNVETLSPVSSTSILRRAETMARQ